MSIIESNIDNIGLLCRNHHVHSMSVFGSVLTDRFNDDSDIDMLVSFNELPIEDYADNFLQLMESLPKLLGRDIDLVEEKAIRNPVFRNIVEKTKMKIYG